MNQPWQTVSCPEEAGISSKGLLAYLDAVEASGLEHHSILILRHGKLALTMNWKPYGVHTPHMLFSLSKSFCSAAAGFAVAEGLLSWDSKVLEVLKEDAPEKPSPWLEKITLSHLLMMGSGLREESDSTDTVAQTLAWDCSHEPGTWFHYNSHGTFLVSAMVQKAAGMTIRDYLIPRLFAPLGIPTPEWDQNQEGICWGGWGLHLSADSILRFGKCLLQKGMWEGKRVLPEGWVELASRKHIDNSNGNPDPDNEWQQGYGYQFWRTRGNRYRGDGMMGQICMISEEQDMVVAITAGIGDMKQEMDLLHRYLFPAAEMEPGTPEEQTELLRRARELHYPALADDASGTLEEGLYCNENVELSVGSGADGLCGMELRFKGPFEDDDQPDRLRMSIRAGAEAEVVQNPEACEEQQVNTICYGGWQEGTLHVLVRVPGAPFTLLGSIQPNEGGLHLKIDSSAFPNIDAVLEKH